jgi:DNA invertase Pin-like site-specific DNA recombinase
MMMDGWHTATAASETDTMNGQHIGYTRVSSISQNTERQLDGIDLDRLFTEKASGSSADKRDQLKACIAYLRDGDTLHVHSIDRLARNLIDLQQTIATLTEKNVAVTFHKEGLTFAPDQNDPFARLMLQQLGAFAEFERSMIRERQREGIEKAKARGQQLGRKRSLTTAQVDEARRRRAAGESATELAREFGISRAAMYTYLKQSETP